jgi:hypothetical protein
VALLDCQRVRVSDSTILDRRQPPRMLAAIEVTGGRANAIQNNLVQPGRDAAILCPADAGSVGGNTVIL